MVTNQAFKVMPRARRLSAKERRRQIIETARGVFASQNYGRAGTADLAKAAGISEPALYRYFASKKELFLATLRDTGARLLEIWRTSPMRSKTPWRPSGRSPSATMTTWTVAPPA